MKILLAIDESPCSAAAAQAVAEQFRSDRTQVRVLHAVEWPKDLPPCYGFAEGPSAAGDVLAWRARLMSSADALVARTAEHLQSAGFTSSASVREGDARSVIVDEAAEWGADVIVMGSHGRRGLDRLVLGSVAEGVMRRAPCSVQIVRVGSRPHPSLAVKGKSAEAGSHAADPARRPFTVAG
jgi:nucleotide-binding universal stress UspA family protein